MNFFKRHICLAPDDGTGAGSSSPAPSSGTPAASTGAGSEPSSSSGASSPSPASAGGSASPAQASPAAAPSSSPTPQSDGDGQDFNQLGVPTNDDDILDLLGGQNQPPPVVDAGAQPAPGAPAPQPAAAPAPQPAAPPNPQQGSPAPSPQGISPDLSLADPVQLGAMLQQNFDQLIPHLAQNEFALSPEDLSALETDAPGHIPTLLARVHLKGQMNTLNLLQRMVPQMIQRSVQVMRKNMENEQAFYSSWPGLDRVKHGQIVQSYARLFRAQNPQATREQMIQALGPIVAQAAGVADPRKAVVNGAPQGRVQPSPFVPAMPGPAASPQPAEADPWSGMAPGQDFD